MKRNFRRSIFFLVLGGAFFVLPLSAAETKSADWVLAAQKFTFSQRREQSASSLQFATVLPQLILEQIAVDGTRVLPNQEVLDRKLNELQTERLSLFLQLSKEYQSRDALVLNNPKPKKLTKALETSQKKIDELQKKIDENLSQVEEVSAKFQPKINREEAIARGEKVEEEKQDRWRFPFPFFADDEDDEPVVETVTIYRNDSTALFSPSEAATTDGITSRTYEKEVTGAKINGLLTGSIKIYGDYMAVTSELYVYPGARLVGAITEVGTISDQMDLAERIVQQLVPKIANSLPVNMIFEVMPEEAAAKARLTVDGLVYLKVPPSLQVDASVHSLSVEAKGFETASFTYKFEGNEQYRIRISMTPAQNGVLNLRLKKPRDGIFYAKGLEASSVDATNQAAKVTVNGKSVLGIFKTGKEDDATSAFFYIPENRAQDGLNLKVNAKPFNREQNIDKRRRWMYTAYTALICSMPFTFYVMGNSSAAAKAYNTDKRISYDEAKKWQTVSNVTAGISIGCGAWFVFELVRYLIAANQVLPATATIDNRDFTVPTDPETVSPPVTDGADADSANPDGANANGAEARQNSES